MSTGTPEPYSPQRTPEVEAARAKQARLVALVRERGFKDAGVRFTDAQIWQALVDSGDWGGHVWDNAAAKLLEHVIEGRPIPSSPTYRAEGQARS